jgi:hypothetical protein
MFQRILFIGGTELYRQIKGPFEAELFSLDVSYNCAEALRLIMAFEFELILCETPSSFPVQMFRLAVERTKPNLARRILFLISMATDEHARGALRSMKAPLLWTPCEMHVLFETIDCILERRPPPRA